MQGLKACATKSRRRDCRTAEVRNCRIEGIAINFPQRLKPFEWQLFTARLKPCPLSNRGLLCSRPEGAAPPESAKGTVEAVPFRIMVGREFLLSLTYISRIAGWKR